MRIKYIGFGGNYSEYPCYEDENGTLYFDINDGRNGLDLYTGAYRHSKNNYIYGEPCYRVDEPIECDNLFIRHSREFDYMMLDRLKSDCDYFLGYGAGSEGNLYYQDVNKHCNEMKKLYDSFSDTEKPVWLTAEQIEKYKTDMFYLLQPKEKEEIQ